MPGRGPVLVAGAAVPPPPARLGAARAFVALQHFLDATAAVYLRSPPVSPASCARSNSRGSPCALATLSEEDPLAGAIMTRSIATVRSRRAEPHSKLRKAAWDRTSSSIIEHQGCSGENEAGELHVGPTGVAATRRSRAARRASLTGQRVIFRGRFEGSAVESTRSRRPPTRSWPRCSSAKLVTARSTRSWRRSPSRLGHHMRRAASVIRGQGEQRQRRR